MLDHHNKSSGDGRVAAHMAAEVMNRSVPAQCENRRGLVMFLSQSQARCSCFDVISATGITNGGLRLECGRKKGFSAAPVLECPYRLTPVNVWLGARGSSICCSWYRPAPACSMVHSDAHLRQAGRPWELHLLLSVEREARERGLMGGRDECQLLVRDRGGDTTLHIAAAKGVQTRSSKCLLGIYPWF